MAKAVRFELWVQLHRTQPQARGRLYRESCDLCRQLSRPRTIGTPATAHLCLVGEASTAMVIAAVVAVVLLLQQRRRRLPHHRLRITGGLRQTSLKTRVGVLVYMRPTATMGSLPGAVKAVAVSVGHQVTAPGPFLGLLSSVALPKVAVLVWCFQSPRRSSTRLEIARALTALTGN